MAIREETELVTFDATTALEAGRDVAGDMLLTCIEYTEDGWHSLYVADQVFAMYEDREHMMAHFQQIYEEQHVDVGERDLMEQELSDMGPVQYFVTYMDMAVFARVVTQTEHHDIEGVWITYAPGGPIFESLEAIKDHVSPTSDTDRPYES